MLNNYTICCFYDDELDLLYTLFRNGQIFQFRFSSKEQDIKAEIRHLSKYEINNAFLYLNRVFLVETCLHIQLYQK